MAEMMGAEFNQKTLPLRLFSKPSAPVYNSIYRLPRYLFAHTVCIERVHVMSASVTGSNALASLPS